MCSNNSTEPISSEVYQYRQEHGRTYHAYKDGSKHGNPSRIAGANPRAQNMRFRMMRWVPDQTCYMNANRLQMELDRLGRRASGLPWSAELTHAPKISNTQYFSCRWMTSSIWRLFQNTCNASSMWAPEPASGPRILVCHPSRLSMLMLTSSRAHEHPSARVIGVDLSPTQPE